MAAKKEKNTKGTVTKVTDSEARKEALLTALKGIRKDFGEGSIMKLGENKHTKVDVYPTGILSIDAALGVGAILPGETGIVLAAMALADSPLHVALAVVAAAAGAFLGDHIGFAVGRSWAHV